MRKLLILVLFLSGCGFEKGDIVEYVGGGCGVYVTFSTVHYSRDIETGILWPKYSRNFIKNKECKWIIK